MIKSKVTKSHQTCIFLFISQFLSQFSQCMNLYWSRSSRFLIPKVMKFLHQAIKRFSINCISYKFNITSCYYIAFVHFFKCWFYLFCGYFLYYRFFLLIKFWMSVTYSFSHIVYSSTEQIYAIGRLYTRVSFSRCDRLWIGILFCIVFLANHFLSCFMTQTSQVITNVFAKFHF